MKTIRTSIIIIALQCGFIITAAEPRAGKYMAGTVSRDVAGALARAKSAAKPVAILTYDPKADAAVERALSFFFSLAETKRMLAANYVQVLAPWNASGIEAFRDMNDKTGSPTIVFLDKSGAFVARFAFDINPKDALHNVQEITAKLGGK